LNLNLKAGFVSNRIVKKGVQKVQAFGKLKKPSLEVAPTTLAAVPSHEIIFLSSYVDKNNGFVTHTRMMDSFSGLQ